jgi:Na+/H+-dicarboxylate symporter
MERNHDLMSPARSSLLDLVRTVDFLRRSALWVQVLIGMVLGIVVGILLGPDTGWVREDLANQIGLWLALPGNLFLRLIQSVVVALVMSSIIVGLASGEDDTALKRVGVRVIPFFIVTTVIACIIGVVVAGVIQPGQYIDAGLIAGVEAEEGIGPSVGAADTFQPTSVPEQIVELIPGNFVVAVFHQNMLQIVVFSVLVGIALIKVSREHKDILLRFFEAMQAIAMKVVAWAMVIAPLAVFGLLAQITIQVGTSAILSMGIYVGTVLLGLLILLAVYLIIVRVVAGIGPVEFLSKARDAMLLAFSTSSSAAVMPLSIKTAEEGLGVRDSISKLVIPLGATVNMAGTALYQVAAAVFLTQVYQVELTTESLIVLIVTVVGASIGSPASPGVGIIILATVLTRIGVPAEGIALIIGVDRILDMSRTAVNLTGDLVACVVTERWIGEEPAGEHP